MLVRLERLGGCPPAPPPRRGAPYVHALRRRELPGVDLDDPRLAGCCDGAANLGPTFCTCWEPVYDTPRQAAPRTGLPTETRPLMCGDCAYRPGSPERRGDPTA